MLALLRSHIPHGDHPTLACIPGGFTPELAPLEPPPALLHHSPLHLQLTCAPSWARPTTLFPAGRLS